MVTLARRRRRPETGAARRSFEERHVASAALLGLLVLVLVGTLTGYAVGAGLADVLTHLLAHLGLSTGPAAAR